MNFDRAIAVALAESLAALYRGEITNTISNQQTDTQVRVEEGHDGEMFVIFPGSASMRDWMSNLQVRLVPWIDDASPDRVHRGFGRAFWSVKTELLRRLESARTIYLAGHSLGGALATLTAKYLAEMGHLDRVAGVYLYGSPRVGNAAFARAYNQALGYRTFRFCNAGDPVPHIPWLFGRYRHVDTQVYLDRDGGVRWDQPLRVAAREIRHAVAAVDHQQFALFGSAHGIDEYLAKIKAAQS